MINLGTIEHEELDLVNRLVHHCDPAEHQGNGVLLKAINGKRVWQVGAQTTCMTIAGGDAEFEGSFVVFGRFIQAAFSQLQANGSCEMFVVDEKITSKTEGGTTTMALGIKIPEFRKFEEPDEVSALIPLREYIRIFGTITNNPAGFHDWETLFNGSYKVIVEISDGKATMRSHWPELKAPEISMSCKAETTGTGKVILTDRAIAYMSLCIHPNQVDVIRLSFAAKDPTYARFESGPVSMVVERFDSGLTKLFRQFIENLDKQDLSYEVSKDGIIIVDIDDTPIRVQLFDGSPNIARCTRVILSEAKSTPELLEEINKLNVNRVLNRIWFDNGMVVIGSDLVVYTDINSIVHTLHRVKKDSEDLEFVFSHVIDSE